MDKEKKDSQMETSTKVVIDKESHMGKDGMNGNKEVTMKVILWKGCDKAEENGLIQTGQFMKVNMFLT